MAGILEKLSGVIRTRNAGMDLQLEFIRFRRFLENMKEVVNHIEDAKDKLREEYIFDRHYVLSLVDSVLEGASMLAFNSAVLAPSAGERIFLRLDVHKKFAKEQILKSGNMQAENFSIPSLYRDADPETQLLSAVLNWFSGPLPADRPAIMDFIRYVTDEVLGNCRKETLINKVKASVGTLELSKYGSLKLIDIDGISSLKNKQTVSPADIKCRPFGLLFIGFQDKADSGVICEEEPGIDRWMLFNEDEASLRISGNNRKIHLEAMIQGNVVSDFIFLYSQNPFDLKSVLPQGSWVEKTGQGNLAWIYDVPTDQLERQLVQLGSILLC